MTPAQVHALAAVEGEAQKAANGNGQGRTREMGTIADLAAMVRAANR